MKTIEIVVDPDGNCKIDAIGFKGKGCEVTKKLEEALGTVKSSTKKPEYYAQETQKVSA